MKIILKLIIVILFSISANAREEGETEITTQDGIEVYQNEKFYLLKKNVKIKSDSFNLNADNVRVDFDESLYDITELEAKGNVNFISQQFKMNGSGEKLNFKVLIEELKVEGVDSELITENVKMHSDGYVKVNNNNGNFTLKGENSRLINENILIIAESIEGIFSKNKDNQEITFLDVFDNKISYVKNNDIEMYAKKILFDNKSSLIELLDDVTIIRDGEKITGDYGTLDTKNNSYKIKSNNETKVRVIIQNDE